MKLRIAPLALLALAPLAASPAQAATLTTDRACYAEQEPLTLSGTGFTPNAPVRLALDGTPVLEPTADAAGSISARGPAPVIDPSRQRRFSLVATDTTNPALTASATPFATVLDVTATPTTGRKTRVRKIVARGFTQGKTLYLHVRRKRYKRNIKLGRLKAPCGTKTVRKRLFTSKAPSGVYRLQFDAKARYSSRTLPRVVLTYIVVTRIVRRSSAADAAYVPPGWVGLP